MILHPIHPSELLKLQFRIFIIWIFIWVKPQGSLPVGALDVVRFGTAGDAKDPGGNRGRNPFFESPTTC